MTEPNEILETALSIAGFGALGAVTRYAVSHLPTYFGLPIGTIVVNIFGSFLLGLATSVFVSSPSPTWLKIGLTTGFLGSFTTFSTFSVENAKLLQQEAHLLLTINVMGQLIVGVGMALLGIYLGMKWTQG